MEPEVREFLKRIMNSIVAGLIWLALNSTFGIMYGYGFPDEKWTAGNYVFFIWFIASFVLLIWFYIRLWKETFTGKDDV